MLHLTMDGTVLTLSVLAFILSISSFGIILLYYCCCREHERNQYRGDGGFAVKYDNTNSHGSIALEEINKDECQLDNLSDHHYEEIPSARVSFEDIYIDDTIEDQKKYMDNVSDTVQMPERIYYTLKDFNKQEENTPCQCKEACLCYHIYH